MGHEMVGIVESVGTAVTHVKSGDRVTVNVETFCGECFFCRHGFVNNCTDQNGGWALGCRIDGGQTLLVGDVLATGFWAAKISEIKNEDTVLIIGFCILVQNAKQNIMKRIKPQMERKKIRSICGSPYKHILILLTSNFDSLTDYIP